MEHDDQGRQYEQSGYPSARGYGHPQRGAMTGNTSERVRQSQMPSTRSPTSVPSTGIGSLQGMSGYAYPQGQYTQQLSGSSLQYQPEYSPDSQRQPQFSQYPSNMIYNIPQAQQQSQYDPVQQYQPRQSAAIEALSTQFGVSQYYSPGEPTSAPGPAAIPQQYAAAQFQQQIPYQQSASVGRSGLPSSYSSGMTEYPQPSDSGVLEQQDLAPEGGAYEDAYNQYQDALRETFENTRAGKMIEAGQSLLKISDWLLGHAVELGLVKDEQELHSDRIKLWNEFNLCWLAVLQRQKQNTQAMMNSGQPPPPPQNILQEDFLERMGREITRLCDGVERHGLVDYQMGVWEEEIISALTDCLDLLEGENVDDPAGESSTQAPPSSIR